MNKMNKKAFTIVELIIVIVIIAILAAILIPNLVRYIDKAHVTKDMELVRNLNTALSVDKAENGEHYTMTDALKAAEEFGYNVGKINRSKVGNEILWDSKNDVFCYFNNGNIEYIPEAPKANDNVEDWEYFVIRDVKSSADIDSIYSTYIRSLETTEVITTDKGIDTGETAPKSVVYERLNASDTRTVVIRTNSTSTNIVLNPYVDSTDSTKGDHISFYGKAGQITGPKDEDGNYIGFTVAFNSIAINGKAVGLKAASGHIDLTNAVVEEGEEIIILATTTDVKVSNPNKVPTHAHATSESNANALNAPEDASKKSIGVIWDYDGNVAQNEIDDIHHHIALSEEEIASGHENGTLGTGPVDGGGEWDYEATVEDVIYETSNKEVAKNASYVARIGGKGYETLAAAVSDAVDGDTIVMLKNHTTAAQTFSKTLTLDLNGKAVSGTGVLLTFNGTGSFTIKDSSINGSITGAQVAVKNSGTGTVVIDGGSLIVPDNKQHYGIYNTAAGTIIVNNGLVSGQFGIYNSSTGGTIRVNGGEIRGGLKSGIFCYYGRGDVIITGGTVTSTSEYGISFSSNSSYSSTGQGSLIASGNASISGTYGIFSGNPSNITLSGNTTVTGSGSYGIYLYNTATIPASITINDSAKISGNSKYGVYVYTTKAVNTLNINNNSEISGLTYGVYDYNGVVNINGGFIRSTETDKSKWSYGVYNNGTINFNGGNVESARVGIYESNAAGVVNIEGGTVSATEGVMGKGAVNIKSGTVNASNIAIYDYNASNKLTVNISGGTINSDYSGVTFLSNTSSLSMTDGTINAKYCGVNNNGSVTMSGGQVLVTGYNSTNDTYGIFNQKTVTISGNAVIQNNNGYSFNESTNSYDYAPYCVYTGGTENSPATMVIENGTFTNAPGYGTVTAGPYSTVEIYNGTFSGSTAAETIEKTASVKIYGGSFNATGSQVCYAYEGFFTISGGTFIGSGSTNVEDHIYRYTLNCLDSSFSADPATAGFTVTGGSFYQFNPQNDLSEGENTCFTPEGYHTEYNELTGYYTLVENN